MPKIRMISQDHLSYRRGVHLAPVGSEGAFHVCAWLTEHLSIRAVAVVSTCQSWACLPCRCCCLNPPSPRT